jgi:hypothetical protein
LSSVSGSAKASSAVEVDPDFGLEHRASRLEDADHAHGATRRELEALAQRELGLHVQQAAAHDGFRRAGLDGAPGRHVYL